jgi:hypothetical protein
VGAFTSPFFELPHGGENAPTEKGYAKIYSNEYAFAALKADGSIRAWGYPQCGGFFELPHALIEPSALRIAKAFRVE